MAGTGGKRPGSGRKSWRHEFESFLMLKNAAGILNDAMTAKKTLVSPSEKQRQHLATEVFKKLAPSKVEIDGEMKHTGIVFQRPDGTVIKL
jgi:hypothetical protein